ncbi:MAG: serine hydroxymethyltransferase [Planctomycetota bacterium]|jgi:glycine hydroxymethyltransferase|nr:serine hydroxymethyltransferase [Planctomycetota bacterium]
MNEFVAAADPEIAAVLAAELGRQREGLELIASENFPSLAVLQAQGSCLTNKYAEGYPGRRYYGGCEEVDKAETLAIDRAKALFGAEYANVQPHAGSQANMAAYLALINPGDRILGMDLAQGGHLTHGYRINFSGRLFQTASYGVRRGDERIDYDALARTAREFRPRLIIAGASAYPRIIDFGRFAEIAREVGAFFLVDMAHIAGLVAAGLHPSPVPHADLVTSTTHKTLRGPRAGLILGRAEHAKKVDAAVFPGLQGGPLMHVVAAKAVAFREAAEPAFRDYMGRVVKNAAAMAERFAREGFRVVSGGTDNHLLLVDVHSRGLTGREAEEVLAGISVTVNKNQIPFDSLPPLKASGIRLGTPAATSRGMEAEEMSEVAGIICEALENRSDPGRLRKCRERIRELGAAHPLYPELGSVHK